MPVEEPLFSASKPVDEDGSTQRVVVVTGGAGFVGQHIVQLFAQDESVDWKVVVFDLIPFDHEIDKKVSSIVGDLTRLGDVVAAFSTAHLVVHAATASPLDNKNQALMTRVNIDGTKNVVEACKQCHVRHLIYISSASVVFDGHDLLNVTEQQPFPKSFMDYYSWTKAEGEKLVLAANNKSSLITCAIRPSAVFGEGDRAFVPRLVEAGRSGKSKYLIGDGSPLWDFTYVGNISLACLQLAHALDASELVCAGQAYFVTNCEPRRFWEVSGILTSRLGYPPPSIHIPAALCFVLAFVLEVILLLLRPVYVPKKPLTFSRQRIALLTTSRTFSCDKARRDFGYRPRVSMDDAIDRTIEYFISQGLSASSDRPLPRLEQARK